MASVHLGVLGEAYVVLAITIAPVVSVRNINLTDVVGVALYCNAVCCREPTRAVHAK